MAKLVCNTTGTGVEQCNGGDASSPEIGPGAGGGGAQHTVVSPYGTILDFGAVGFGSGGTFSDPPGSNPGAGGGGAGGGFFCDLDPVTGAEINCGGGSGSGGSGPDPGHQPT